MSQNLNIRGVFPTNQLQMEQKAVGRCRAGGGLQLPSYLDLQLEWAGELHKHCFCLFLCMVFRQCFGKRIRDQE